MPSPKADSGVVRHSVANLKGRLLATHALLDIAQKFVRVMRAVYELLCQLWRPALGINWKHTAETIDLLVATVKLFDVFLFWHIREGAQRVLL